MRKIFLGAILGLVFVSLVVFYLWLRPPAGRTNFLVLGVAGEGYAGGDLTDTMMFVSIDNQTAQVLVLSLPRDIWVASLRTKLNGVYHYQGLFGTKEVVAEILGQPIDYAVVIDFDVFVDLIDVLGGVEVEVAKTFDDYRYPISGKENDLCENDPTFGCRYEHLHFDAGRQLMDGSRALKYVRSRFAVGEEGTDFARNQRQQNLLMSLKNKLFSPAVILNPRQLLLLFRVVGQNIQTDLPKEKITDLARTTFRFRADKLITKVLNNRLFSPPLSGQHDNQWVLLPASGDWQEIQKYIRALINN